MENTSEIISKSKLLKSDVIVILLLIICSIAFIPSTYFEYKNHKISEVYASQVYEIYRKDFMPMIDSMSREKLHQLYVEYMNSTDSNNSQDCYSFSRFFYNKYNLNYLLGRYSNVHASGMQYFSGKVSPVNFDEGLFEVRVNSTANLPYIIEATINDFYIVEDVKAQDAFFQRSSSVGITDYKNIDEIYENSIKIHKDVMELMDKELTKSGSYSKAISKAAKYLNINSNKINRMY